MRCWGNSMKKLVAILFYVFLIFLIANPIWPRYEIFNYIFSFIFLGLSILIFIFSDKKKIKIDMIDILLGLLPFFYILPFLLKRNLFNFSYCFEFILLEFALTVTILILKRYLNKTMINDLLITICLSGVIYLFVAFITSYMPKFMFLFRISNYFGDTYINSVDRFYGTLDYCNISALFFAICSFVSLFRIYENESEANFFRFTLFINFCGFLITFSKMVSIAFLLVLMTLIILQLFFNRKKFLKILKIDFISLVIPSLLFIKIFRYYLINLNIFLFLFIFILLFLFFIVICLILEYLDKRFKYSSLLYFVIECFIMFYLIMNPISVSLKVNNVSKENDFIISDFILENNKDYTISFDVDGEYGNSKFQLCYLYVEQMIPKEECILNIVNDANPSFKFATIENFEYYFIKIIDLNSNTNLKIKNLKINNSDYLINSFLVPYQFVHQLELTKYDKESVTHRFDYYKDSFNVIKNNNLIFGGGVDTFAFYALKGNFNYLETDPHSYFFQLWLDVGIYGVIYVVLLVIFGIFYMWKYRMKKNKLIWFCIFSLCMIILPFDAVYSVMLTKVFLMLSFSMVCRDAIKKL